MLARVVWRTRRATLLDEVVVATTSRSCDEAIVSECRRLGAPVFRGEEEDVLDRYYRSAQAFKAEGIVRITSDCPLIDPEIIDLVVSGFFKEKPSYASNTLNRTYPRGLDAEVVSMSCLERAWHEAHRPFQRAHVTPFIYQHPVLFRLLSITANGDYSNHRWTVDTPDDLVFARAVYSRLGNRDSFGWQDVLKVLSEEPELMELNRHIRQKETERG